MENVDFKGMAEYYLKSERTLRRWAVEKEDKFLLMVEEYKSNFQDAPSSSIVNNKNGFEIKSTVIATLSLKGGVGKSTISDIFGYYLTIDDDAIILNLDMAQRASNVNSCKTIDYADYIKDIGVGDLIRKLSIQYKYIIIDTPGDPTIEVLEALKYATKLLIPMTIGKRTRETTRATLMTFFGGDTALEGRYDVFFFFNAYTDKKKRGEAAELFREEYASFNSAPGLELRPKLGALDSSNAISTAEETGKSIFQLVKENKTAYGNISKKLTFICSQIEEHFGINQGY